MKASITQNKAAQKIGLFCICILVWQVVSLFYPPVVLPGPVATAEAFLRLFTTDRFLSDILVSTYRLIVGITGAVVIGCTLGILMGISRGPRQLIEPLIYFIQGIPPILYMTLAMIWFGLNGRATIFIVFIVSMPVMAVNIEEGFQNIDPKLMEMGENFKFSRTEILKSIVLPSLKSYFKSGFIIVAGLGWKLVVMGEFLSASTGLGARITDARVNLETEKVFAWGLVIIVLCLLSQKAASVTFPLPKKKRKSHAF